MTIATRLLTLMSPKQIVTNGGFDTDTIWAKSAGWAIANGVATFTANSTNAAFTETAAGRNTGKKYTLTYDVIANTLNAGNLRIGSFSGASFFGLAFVNLPITVGHQIVSGAYTPVGAGNVLDFFVTSAATSGALSIDNLSLR